MNNKWKMILTAVALSGALACTMTTLKAGDEGAPAQPTHKAEGKERHPQIRRAIKALEEAREHLKKADHDFGGHRVKAIEDCDKAIEQLKLALQYDKD
jgi:hypothetical protein